MRQSACQSAFDLAAARTCASLSQAFGVPLSSRADSSNRSNPDLGGDGTSFGIEIEVPFSSFFPELWAKYRLQERRVAELPAAELAALGTECAAIEQSLLPRLHRTVECGVARGADRYWEFAVRPAHRVELLAEQVRILTRAGLLPRDRKHSLQVTIGGLAPCRELYYLAMLLEVEFVDPERVRAGVAPLPWTVHPAWGRKGTAGIHRKGPADLEGGCQVASELRLLELPRTDAELDRLLAIVAWGACAILDLRRGAETHGAIQWRAFEATAQCALVTHGLPARNWGRGPAAEQGVVDRAAWLRFASCMPAIAESIRSGHPYAREQDLAVF